MNPIGTIPRRSNGYSIVVFNPQPIDEMATPAKIGKTEQSYLDKLRERARVDREVMAYTARRNYLRGEM